MRSKRRVLGILAISVLLMTWAPGQLAAVGPGNGNGNGLGNQQQQREKHLKDDKKAHSDASGKVRHDLWQKGVADFGKMKIQAFRPLSTGTAGGVAPGAGLAPLAAGGSGVTGVQWTQIGPAPLVIDAEQNYQGTGPDAGQVTGIAIDPRNSTDRVIFAAFNDGGIWKTTDGGTNWTSQTDYMPSLSMGAVALDPGNPSIVYAGTGNLFNNGFQKGVGIYRSIDGGDTWSVVAGSAALLAAGPANVGTGINKIVMPAPNVLLVATDVGLFRSVDGGASFGNNAPSFNNGSALRGGFVSDLDLDTQSPSTIVYASISGRTTGGAVFAGGGVFKSTDGGQTFPASGNLFAGPGAPPSGYGYVSMAQSTTDSGKTIYADADDPTSGVGAYVVKSTDSGANWSSLAAGVTVSNDNKGCQCGYDQTIGVDPQDENRVYLGFQELYRSEDGGTSFSKVSGSLIHWDHHDLVFSPSTHWGGSANTRVYVGTDGGTAYSDNNGSAWTNINGAIATSLFRAMDIGRGTGDNAWSYGGQQDTGTVRHSNTDTGTQWHEAVDGDGGPVAVDWTDPQKAYGSSNGGYIRTINGGTGWIRPGSGSFSACFGMTAPPAVDPNDGANVFVAQSTASVVSVGPPLVCGAATQQLWRSTDTGVTFSSVYTAPTSISFIATTPTDSNTVWLGLGNGQLAFSSNALAATPTFTVVNVPGRIAGQGVAGVAIDPSNVAQVVVVYQGFSGIAPPSLTGHVFRTQDSGATWADIGGTSNVPNQVVPDLPLYSVAIDPGTTPDSIIVSSDVGVMRTLDSGATWQVLGIGLPNVNGTSLQIDSTVQPSLLRIGTYGRSAFELTASTGPLLGVNADLAFGVVGIGASATRVVQLFNVGSTDLHVSGFGPATGSSPDFTVLSGPSAPVTIPAGQEVDYTIRFKPTAPAGPKTATFQVTSDDQFNPITMIPASGTAATGIIAVSGDLDFGVVARGTTASRDITVYNAGLGSLTVSNVLFAFGSDPAFSLVGPATPQTLAAGDHISFTVKFSPLATAGPGTLGGTLRILSNDPSNPSVGVLATGIVGVPVVTAASSSLAFGGVAVDERTVPAFADQIVRITNQASCPSCDVSLISLPITGSNAGDFSVVGAPLLPAKIGAGGHLDLTVRFDPSLAGARSATLTVNTSDPVNPAIAITLSGTGLLPGITPSPTPLIFPPTVYDPPCGSPCGSPANEKLTNTGLAELILDQVTFTPSAFLGAGATAPQTRVVPGGTFTEVVTFHPTSGPTRKVTGTMHVADLLPLDPGNVVSADIPLCGESVGRGIRVMAVDRSGNPIAKLGSLKLSSVGVTPNQNVNLKNLSLVTIDPPNSCQRTQFQYENQNLGSTDQTAPRGSYYTLTVTAGNKHSTLTFGLKVNEFKIIVITVG